MDEKVLPCHWYLLPRSPGGFAARAATKTPVPWQIAADVRYAPRAFSAKPYAAITRTKVVQSFVFVPLPLEPKISNLFTWSVFFLKTQCPLQIVTCSVCSVSN